MSARSPSAADTIRATIHCVIERVNILSAGGPGWTRPSRSDLESAAHAMAKVAGKLDFCLDMRSSDARFPDEADRRPQAEIARIEAARPSIRFDLGRQSRRKPAVFARAGWASGMVFIHNRDGSHCPQEGMDLEALVLAVESVHNSICGEGNP